MVEEKCSDNDQSGSSSPHALLWLVRAALALLVALVFRPVIVQEGVLPFVFGLMMLNFVIVVHELGHLVAALWLRIPVEAFSVGLGSAWASKRWHGIEWRLSLIPFGGFVELGECVRERYKFFVAAAGPIASLLFGFIVMFLATLFGASVRKVVTPLTIAHTSPLARTAGLRPGDVVVSVDGQPVKEDLQVDLRKGRTTSDARSALTMVVRRKDKRLSVTVPIEVDANSSRLGIKFLDSSRRLSAKEALAVAGKTTGILAAQPALLPAMLLQQPRKVAQSVTGPGGVLQLASSAYAISPAYWFFMTGLLSAAVGGFQLLPLVPFDGGRMVEALLQRVLRNTRETVRHGVVTTYVITTFIFALVLLFVGLTRDILR